MARNAVAGVCATCDVHWAFMEGWKELQSMCMPGKITYFVPPSRTVSPTETNTSSIASTPAFDQGDVVLRSSDGVSLHAWRRILSESSPFFRALFDLPQQDTFPADSPECDSSLPVIDCQEDTSTLTSLLQLIYPLPNPTFLTIDELVPALEAAHKYDVPSAVSTLVTLLRSRKLLASDPVRVYALAQRYTLPSLSRAAASACLHTDLDDTSESSVLHLSASAFTRLLAWRNAHSQAIRKALTDTPFAYTCGVCRERWTARWLTLALYEVARRPVGEVIFSWEFILQAMDMERPASVGGHYVSGFGTGPTAATWGGVAVGSGHYCANAVTEGDREWMRALNMRVADLEEEMPEMMVS
ncbi:hypothetical protein DACRYDRAFT_83928 [Dacryopinax primogenitus]|uniref:BTB domain-containing protein n=1 Tax=Dacryopinax primogenitus (strain DJM 731) TaxID=1858805 RepID=M5G375_DACPD|nr:uncharacterized protein DACRYDRAFT_83928 [Dacryopinax primogenitus]EJT98187.1 hypothetical protein DACRYDRAFT_83928 [Dacryopinax primogenitus]